MRTHGAGPVTLAGLVGLVFFFGTIPIQAQIRELTRALAHLHPARTTAGATTWQTDLAPENVYYVVVPHNGDNEGSYGWAGSAPDSSERPASESACFPQVVGSCP